MPLVPLAEVQQDLRCPGCASPIDLRPDGSQCCRNSECELAKTPFPLSRGMPALVDFDRSVLSPSALSNETGVLERRAQTGLRKFFRRNLLPYNRRASENCDRFLKLLKARSSQPLVLVIGGGAIGSGAEALYSTPGVRVVGFDIYGSANVQLIADAHQIPFAQKTFDGVWIQAVLEHVLEPQRVVEELTRVLSDDGIVYAETPFLQGVHEGPYDFTRFTDSGHRWLFRDYELIDSGAVLGPFAQLLWSINQAISALFRSRKAGLAAQLALFWLKYLDALVPDGASRDNASALFFLGRKTGTPITPGEAISYYRGAMRR